MAAVAHAEALVIGQERLGGHRHQEQLERDKHDDVHEHRGRRAVAGASRRRHTGSAPRAQIVSSRMSTSMRPSGRVGGPEITAPVSVAKLPSWHGQCQRFASAS